MKTISADQHQRRASRVSWLLVLAGMILVITLTVLEIWATPPGWLQPARRQTVTLLHWVRVNWLSTTAIGTAAAVAGVLTPFLVRWLDRRSPIRSAGQAREAQQRTVMLQRVRYKWITGVLEPSLADAAQLVLGLERRSDLLGLGARTIRHPGRPPEPLPEGTPISQILDNVGGGLLILGAPGAGKTTALLQLCDELLDRAKHDSVKPIPVVINLASWAHKRLPLHAWLVDELMTSYQVPRRMAIDWIQHEALALLLDGLDEVAEAHRAACTEAINAWRNENGLVPLVVCSRTQELQALGTRLRLEEAVELQPPSDSEVDRYLSYLEATGTPIDDVHAAMADDQELKQLLRSPLLLHVVALAYHGRPASALFAAGTLQQRQVWLWEAYVARMFEQRPLNPDCGYTGEQALRWLTSLAQALRDRDQTEFHLDRLAPEWLPTRSKQRGALIATGLAGGLVAGPLLGLAFALVVGAFLDFGLISGLVFGLIAGPTLGLVAGPFLGLAAGITGSVDRSEQTRWSWSKERIGLVFGTPRVRASPNGAIEDRPKRAPVAVAFGIGGGLAAGAFAGLASTPTTGLAAALTFGFTFGLCYGLAGELSVRIEPAEQVRWSWSRLRAGLPRALVGGLIGGLVLGLVFGVSGGLSAGLAFGPILCLIAVLLGGLSAGLTGGLRDERAVPNEGIRRSAQHAVAVGLVAGVVSGLSCGVAIGLSRGLTSGLTIGLGAGLGVTSVAAMMFGEAACLQHYVVRAYLAREGVGPWKYGPFLDAMAERLMLRRSGGAYLFVHRLLRDYFAASRHDRTESRSETAPADG